jgi:hypothetical protein
LAAIQLPDEFDGVLFVGGLHASFSPDPVFAV